MTSRDDVIRLVGGHRHPVQMWLLAHAFEPRAPGAPIFVRNDKSAPPGLVLAAIHPLHLKDQERQEIDGDLLGIGQVIAVGEHGVELSAGVNPVGFKPRSSPRRRGSPAILNGRGGTRSRIRSGMNGTYLFFPERATIARVSRWWETGLRAKVLTHLVHSEKSKYNTFCLCPILGNAV